MAILLLTAHACGPGILTFALLRGALPLKTVRQRRIEPEPFCKASAALR